MPVLKVIVFSVWRHLSRAIQIATLQAAQGVGGVIITRCSRTMWMPVALRDVVMGHGGNGLKAEFGDSRSHFQP